MTTTVKIEYRPAPALERILRALPAEETRHRLASEGASSAAGSVAKYLRALSASRHATASSLGATPTQVIGRTASGVKAEERDGAAVVVVPHPLFRRAFRDIEIAPQKAASLAIPIHRLAYGRSPRTIAGLFLFKAKGQAFLAKSEGKRPRKTVCYYLLHRGRVLQPRDETLLPSQDTLALSAKAGVSRFLAGLFLSSSQHPT